MRRFCLCLLISLPALLAEPAHTTNATVQHIGASVDSPMLSTAQIKRQVSNDVTTQKTREFASWLNFATVPDAINLVHGLMDDPDMVPAQKEAIMMRLTHHLRSSTPTAADRAVIMELTGYESQVLTQHHEDPHYTQPAFNIAVSAQGTLNEWRFQDINAGLNGSNIIQAWDNADVIDRRNILAGLRNNHMGTARLVDIQATAMQHRDTHADLAATTSLTLGDIQTAADVASSATPATALSMLKHVASTDNQFTLESSVDLLKAISTHSDPAISGLALNTLAKRYANPEAINTLITQLPDPVNGANAAMTLATVLTDTQINKLQAQADENDHMLQARIKLIRQLHEEAR